MSIKYTTKTRNFPKTTGVYLIGFVGSDKKYIGSASCTIYKSDGFNGRWRNHISKFRKNKHTSPYLQNAFNKYGEENMFFEILVECRPEFCLEQEQFYIDKYDSFRSGYNIRPKAENNLGFKHSEKSKQLMVDRAKEWLDTQTPKVMELFHKGLNGREISRKLNIGRSTVGKIVKLQDKSFPRVGSKPRNVKQFDEQGNLINQWHSIEEASKHLDLSESTIRRYLNNEVAKPKYILKP